MGITLANAVQPAMDKAVEGYPKIKITVEVGSVSLLFGALATFVLTTFWALYFLTEVVNRR